MGLYLKCFVKYIDFPLNNHVAKSAHGQQLELRKGIPDGIHLNLIRGT